MAESISKTYKALRVIKLGESPVVEELETPRPGPNEILVRVKFSPVNPSDMLTAAGHYPSGLSVPFTLGSEGSGVVVEVGPDCIVPHKVGDEVSVIAKEVWAEYVLLKSFQAIKLLNGNTLEEGASHFVNPAAVVCMVEDEVIKGGHKAAIHTAGSSSLGKMMIRFLKQNGLRSINIVRKEEYIKDLLEAGADYVLNSSSEAFDDDLKKAVADTGASIVLDAIGNPLLSRIIPVLPNGSHVVSYGVMDKHLLDGISLTELIFKGKTLRGFWLSQAFQALENQRKMEVFIKCQMNLKTSLRSDINQAFSIEDYKQAFEEQRKNASKGKTLFKL